MTGTGTQADPYIPTTLTEFITAVGTAGAYVTLDRDINAADDPEYTGELTSRIDVHAAEVDGAEHSIEGVTVRSPTLIYLQERGCSVKNVNFRKFALQQTGLGTIIAGRDGTTEAFKGCTISANVTFFTRNSKLFGYVDFDECGIDISFSNPLGDTIMEYTILQKSTVRIHGSAPSSSVNNVQLIRSALIFDAGEQTGYKFSTLTARYSYVAFLKRSESPIAFGRTWMSTIGCVLAVADGQQTSYVPSGTTVGTLSQMTNKDWLTSVGFLP